MSDWSSDPDDFDDLLAISEMVKAFRRDLPGWWLSFGECSVSCHASCGPDRQGKDRHLLAGRGKFDDGFHADIDQPSRMADAINDVRRQALKAMKGAAE